MDKENFTISNRGVIFKEDAILAEQFCPSLTPRAHQNCIPAALFAQTVKKLQGMKLKKEY